MIRIKNITERLKTDFFVGGAANETKKTLKKVFHFDSHFMFGLKLT